ncbi:KCNC1 [Mytilus coruscus]|uniref:KCNC1 n=1 Tax=Mytilus coruscus TaxID=42192 RepID=A0A6J8BUV5_MYTCO|nr:KCNC1 [Mytilus coruscus]
MDTTEKVLLNVSGKLYQIHKNIKCKLPTSQKSQLISYNGTDQVEYVYYKNRELFERVINFFGGSSLHIPNTMCPVEFEEELEFWKIKPKELSPCCYIKYKQRENARGMINKFLTHRRKKFDKDQIRIQLNKPYVHQLRIAVWNIIEFNTKCTLSKVYLIVSAFFILSAVFGIALSTLPVFREKYGNLIGNKNKPLHQSADLTTQTHNSPLQISDEITTQTHKEPLPLFLLSDYKEQLPILDDSTTQTRGLPILDDSTTQTRKKILDDSTTQTRKGGLPVSEDSTTQTHKEILLIPDDSTTQTHKERLLVSDDSTTQTHNERLPVSEDSTTQTHKERRPVSDDSTTQTQKERLPVSDDSTTQTHKERRPVSDDSTTQTHRERLPVSDDSTTQTHKERLPVSVDSTTQTHKERRPVSDDSTTQTHKDRRPVSDDSTTQTHKERRPISDDSTTQTHKERRPISDDSTTQPYIIDDFVLNNTLEIIRDIVDNSFLPGKISSKFQSFNSNTEENVISALYYMTNSFFLLDVLCRIVCSPNSKSNHNRYLDYV